MNRISTLLNPEENVLIDLDLVSRKRVFEVAAQTVSKVAGVDTDTVFEAFVARERLGSTAVGNGAAIPHARIEGLKEPTLVLLRTSNPIDYDGNNTSQIRLFFALAIPSDGADDYLELLSEVAGFLSDTISREAVMTATTPLKICQAIEAWSPVEH